MSKVLIAPGKYVQGRDVLKNLNEYVKHLGNKFVVIISSGGKKRFGETIEKNFKGDIEFIEFNGECSYKEIDRIRNIIKTKDLDGIIGVGGGKVLDTSKAVGHFEKIPVIVAPTAASSDAPCSALSIVYTEEGVVEDYLAVNNPEVVAVDLQAVANAPSRLIVAGMGDTLATKFEAESSAEGDAINMAGGKATQTALTLADLSYEILLEKGYEAKLAAERKVVTRALEDVVEANTLISGLGFESGGLTVAHAIHDGFTIIKETEDMYHGEKVAFGTLAQLVLENKPREEIEELLYFCNEVGLPTTLEDLGIKEINEKEIMEVAKISAGEDTNSHNSAFEVTAESIYGAIMTADAMGKEFKKYF